MLNKPDSTCRVLRVEWLKARNNAASLRVVTECIGRQKHRESALRGFCGASSCGGGPWYSDWLRAGRSGVRIPVGARFFSHVQTGPGAHPASCTMGTGSYLGVKRPGRGADHPPPPSAEVENE
jgi:hypothetical protein